MFMIRRWSFQAQILMVQKDFGSLLCHHERFLEKKRMAT
jgi:hypothetical protein